MANAIKPEHRHLELAFESSDAILRLEGFNASAESEDLQQRIITGDLDFDEAIKIVVNRAQT